MSEEFEHQSNVVSEKGREWVARLFRYLSEVESGSTPLDFDQFSTLYKHVERAIEHSGEKKEHAHDLDRALFGAISVTDVDSSSLRFVVSHALSIHHFAHADFGRGFEQAYRWCERLRGQDLADLEFMRAVLVPKLFDVSSMGGDPDVCLFLLERLARFENLERVPVWDDEQVDELLRLEPEQIAYQLSRRRIKFSGGKDLTEVPDTLEQGLDKDDHFRELHREHRERTPLLAHLLDRYGYLARPSLWKRVKAWSAEAFVAILERAASPYVTYEMTRRNGALIVQGVLIGVILLGLFLGLLGWGLFTDQRLGEVERDLDFAKERITTRASEYVEERERMRERTVEEPR